jgi:hypothetical protein
MPDFDQVFQSRLSTRLHPRHAPARQALFLTKPENIPDRIDFIKSSLMCSMVSQPPVFSWFKELV